MKNQEIVVRAVYMSTPTDQHDANKYNMNDPKLAASWYF